MKQTPVNTLPRKPGHDLVERVVYGPVRSRRLGWSLGINWFRPNTKVCNFDCVYCQLGPTTGRPRPGDFLAPSVFEAEIKSRFQELAAQGQTIDVITISGNGEPALHPRLKELIPILLQWRDRYFPTARTWILTNGTRCDQPSVARTLNLLDERAIKLDGVDAWLERIDQPLYGFDLMRLVRGLRQLRDYHLQVMLLHGRGENIDVEALRRWAAFLREHELTPRSIQLYTVDRYPAYADVTPLTVEEMETVAEQLRELVPFQVEIFT